MMIMGRGLGPVDAVISNWKNYSSFLVSLNRLDDLLRDTEREAKKIYRSRADWAAGGIARLCRPPGSEKLILNDVSFTLPQGRVLGVVGPSGAGKSCLARVLVGVWPPRAATSPSAITICRIGTKTNSDAISATWRRISNCLPGHDRRQHCAV